MNSLSDLNTYGQTQLTFTDLRPAKVVFDRASPLAQAVNITQYATHSVPVAINIVEIVNTSASLRIDVSSQSGATVTWSDIPTGCTVTNPSTGVYVITGITTPAIWDRVESPTITPSIGFVGTFTYGVRIVTTTNGNKDYNVVVNVSDRVYLSTPSDVYFNASSTGTLTGGCTVIDTYSTNWTVTVAPSFTDAITTLTTAGSGGTSTFNSTTKVLTIKGTRTQVNSHLNAITYTIPSTNKTNWSLVFNAINDTQNDGDSRTQAWYTLEYISAVRGSDTYVLNTQASLTRSPTITDASFDGSGTYTMTATPVNTSQVSVMSSTGRLSWVSAQTINNPSPAANNEQFGADQAFSIDGQYLAISRPFSNSGIGRVMVYKLTSGTWTLQATLTPTGFVNSSSLWFGSGGLCFNSDGTTLAISCPQEKKTGHNFSTGAVWVFTRSGTTWTQQARLQPSNVTNTYQQEYYGCDMSDSGNNFITSSTVLGTMIFVRSGTTWLEETSIAYPLRSISSDANTIAGGERVYVRTGSDSWALQQTITPSDGIGFPSTWQGSQMAKTGSTLFLQRSNYYGDVSSFTRTPKSVVAAGNASVNTSIKKFGAGSIAFDGNGDTLTVDMGSTYTALGTSTIEFWVYRTANGVEQWITNFGTVTTVPGNSRPCPRGPNIYIGSDNFVYMQRQEGAAGVTGNNSAQGADFADKATKISAAALTTLNTWQFWTFNISFGTTSTVVFKIDGTTNATTTVRNTYNGDTAPSLVIGNGQLPGTSTNNYFNGYIDDFHIVKGTTPTRTSAPTAALVELYTPTSSTALFGTTISFYTQLLLSANINVNDTVTQVPYIASSTTWVYTRSGSTWTYSTTLPHVGYASRDGTVLINANTVSFKQGSTWITATNESGAYIPSYDGAFALKPDTTTTVSGYTSAGSITVYNKTTGYGTSWNATTKTLTLTGSRANVNIDLDTVKMAPTTGTTASILLTWTVTTPRSNTDSRQQTITRV